VGVAIVLALGVLAPGHADDAQSSTEPFDIIDRAIVRWQARPRPTALSYTVDFTGSHNDKSYRRLFRVEYEVATHATRVTELRAEGPAPAFIQPEKQRFVPTETFGFVSRDEAPAAVPPAPNVTSLPVIAAVRAVRRYPYDVSLLGVEQTGEQHAYHLGLKPRQKPDAYPLRELWIDTTTYDVVRAVALQFEQLGPIRVPYRVNVQYAQEGPYWLIRSAQASATIRAGIFSYGSRGEAIFEDFQAVP
jgi:hypothetical protein